MISHSDAGGRLFCEKRDSETQGACACMLYRAHSRVCARPKTNFLKKDYWQITTHPSILVKEDKVVPWRSSGVSSSGEPKSFTRIGSESTSARWKRALTRKIPILIPAQPTTHGVSPLFSSPPIIGYGNAWKTYLTNSNKLTPRTKSHRKTRDWNGC